MFKINIGRLNLKLMSYALERDTSIFFSRSVDGFFTAIDLSPHPHAFTSQPSSARFGQKGNRD